MNNYVRLEKVFEHLNKTIDKFDKIIDKFDSSDCINNNFDRIGKKIDSNNKYFKMIKYGQIAVVVSIIVLIIKILWISFNV